LFTDHKEVDEKETNNADFEGTVELTCLSVSLPICLVSANPP